jgi:excisionase family DNA binding protein
MPRKLITIDEAAEQLRISKRALRHYIAVGHIPAYRVAGVHLIRLDQDEVDQLLVPIPTYKPTGGVTCSPAEH